MIRIRTWCLAAFLVLTALIGANALLAGAARAQEEEKAAAPAAAAAGHEESAEPVVGPGEVAGHEAHEAHAEHSPTEEAFHAAEHVSFLDLILKTMGYRIPEEGQPDTNPPALKLLALFQLPIMAGVVILLMAAFAVSAARKRAMIPDRKQTLIELLVGGLDDFVQGILGLEGRHFVPFLGTLFLYIWVMNMIGIVPLFHAPTSSFNTTVALAICVFLYVQWTGIRRNGLGGYLFHLAGEPRDVIGWSMVVLMLPLHIISELSKPLSLSLRLFGNIFGEDTLIAVFVGLGVATLAFSPVGIPFHTPFLFLAMLTSTIQALVFALLATIYIALMLPHHEHDEHAHAAAGGHH